MAHNVLIKDKVAAKSIDAYVRSAVLAGNTCDAGNLVTLLTKSATVGESEVWTAGSPTTGSLIGLWMVDEAGINILVDGSNSYALGDPDPRNFYVGIAKVFTAIKPVAGDIITMTADGITGTRTSEGYAVATTADRKPNWSAVGLVGTALTMKLLGVTYISIGTGTIGTQRVASYQFEVLNN